MRSSQTSLCVLWLTVLAGVTSCGDSPGEDRGEADVDPCSPWVEAELFNGTSIVEQTSEWSCSPYEPLMSDFQLALFEDGVAYFQPAGEERQDYLWRTDLRVTDSRDDNCDVSLVAKNRFTRVIEDPDTTTINHKWWFGFRTSNGGYSHLTACGVSTSL